MKDSIYRGYTQALKNFSTLQEAINYYQFKLDNNPESSVYPAAMREFDKGLILGLKGAIELSKVTV